MEEVKMEEDKIYSDLITATPEFGEVYLELHHNLTVQQAKKKAKINDKSTCLILTPQNALAVANGLIDIVFSSKIQNKKTVAKEELPNEKES